METVREARLEYAELPDSSPSEPEASDDNEPVLAGVTNRNRGGPATPISAEDTARPFHGASGYRRNCLHRY